jgi:rhomboid protease GluP
MVYSPAIWIIITNLAVYLFLGYQGVDLVSPSTFDLIKWGGNLGPYALTGDKYRLFTSMFLHGGIVHLLMNMYLLFQIGFLSEAVWGKVRFIFIYILTGLFGSLASAYWYSLQSLNNPTAPIPTVSIGASGAVLGISGALLVHAFIEKEKALIDLKIIAQVVLLNIGFGFMNQGVDNACHLGGAISGIVIGSLLLNKRFMSSAVFAVSFIFLFGFISIPVPEGINVLGADLRIGFEEFQRLEVLKKNKLKAEEEYKSELKSIPSPVSMEEASGKYIVVEGGATDFILKNKTYYVPKMELNSIGKIDREDFKLLPDFSGPKLSVVKDSGCADNLCLGRGASGLAVSKNEKWAVVSSMIEDSLSMIDFESGKVLWSVKTGRFPRNTFLSGNEKFAFTINSPDNSLSVVDLEKRSLLFTKQIGEELSGFPFGRYVGAAQSKDKIYFADPMGNKILGLLTEAPGNLETVIELGDFSPNIMTLSSNDERLWISGNGALRSYDTRTFKLIDELKTCSGEFVNEFAIGPKDEWIAIEQQDLNLVRLVSLRSFRTVRVFPSSSGHNLLRFSADGKSLYFFSLQGWASALTKFDISKTLDVANIVAESGETFCY